MKITAFTLLLLLTGFSYTKKKLTADSPGSYLQYKMEHPLHNWEATSRALRCIIVYDEQAAAIEAVAVTVPVNSFDSGNANRDSHALEVLEALKYRNVTFSSTGISETAGKITVRGTLTFHGVSRPVEMAAIKKINENTLQVDGRFSINMKDYGVSPPSLMGVKTKEKIDISFQMAFGLN